MKRSYYAAFMAAAVLACIPLCVDGFHGAASARTLHRTHAPQHFVQLRRANHVSRGNGLHRQVANEFSQSQAAHHLSNKRVANAGSHQPVLHSCQLVAHTLSRQSLTHRSAAAPAPKVEAKASVPKANLRIAQKARQVAKQMNTVGWCYKGVCNALSFFGVHLSGAAAYQAKDQLLSDKRFHPLKVSTVKQLKPGDIMVHGASQSHPYGHIAVYLGDDSEASDHVQPVVFHGPYNGMTVFRYEGT